jgi:uncharacterized protein YhdP
MKSAEFGFIGGSGSFSGHLVVSQNFSKIKIRSYRIQGRYRDPKPTTTQVKETKVH